MTNLKDMRRRFIAQTELGTVEIANEIEKHPEPRTALSEMYIQTIEQIWAAHDPRTSNAGYDLDDKANSGNPSTTDTGSDSGTSTAPTPPGDPSFRDRCSARAAKGVGEQFATQQTVTSRFRLQEGGAACA